MKCFLGDQAVDIWTVEVNQGVTHSFASDGDTSTTKYNGFTFIPKGLFEQFRRVANLYFLSVAVLSMMTFSPVRPWTTWTPLALVVGVSMIKEWLEDYSRWKADKEENNRVVSVMNPATGQFEVRKWKHVLVGDVVKVMKNDYFPADLLFLSASNEEGACYVETMNLDGETNLKIKVAQDATKEMSSSTVASFRATISCEPPNSRLYLFMGNLMPHCENGMQKNPIPLGPSSVLLRGSSLKNTDFIHGAVIYSGHDTKVFQNSGEAPSKRSTLEHMIDKVVIFMFIILFIMCLITAVFFSSWLEASFEEHWYLKPDAEDNVGQYDPDRRAIAGTISFLVGYILYGYLIPISLYVSMEVVKVWQAMVLITKDRDMYHAASNTQAMARTSNLNEDLGKVNAVLSDKTGTLTQNVMEFFKCSIGGVSYGTGITEIERSNSERRGIPLPPAYEQADSPLHERYFNFYDERLLSGAWQNEGNAAEVEMFYRMLAVCHTVVPDGPTNEKEIKYEAESPDEAALVVAAKVMGFFFFKRSNTTVTVRETTAAGTAEVEYELLNVLEFNSTRKRMSVIVRDSKGNLLLFCKGADTVIYERLDPQYGPNKEMKTSTSAHMEDYGASGLRTLCLSWKPLDDSFYKEWQVKWKDAKISMTKRDERIAELSELVEGNLRLLGATAIEDKLQDGVGQCIKQLADAGIRLWVLTGDKMETAINIAFACSLVTEEMRQVTISSHNAEIDALEAAGDAEGAAMLGNIQVEEQLKAAEEELNGHAAQDHVIIIDGKSLSFALSGRLLPLFLAVGMRCKAAICCRVSPLQKAQVTGAVKSVGLVTLAIGDGANDVGMIQKAHIGVGISGKEGMQAVMASDFAIAQFSFLTPLLLVHGRWSYKRIARMVNYFFYKNLFFGITLFIFNAFTRFSGSFMYDDVYMTLFNVIFTVLMPIVIGVFDREVDKQLGYKFPVLYQAGVDNTWFNAWAVCGWFVSATLQPCIICAFCLLGTWPTISSSEGGHPWSMYEAGILMFSCVVLTIHLHLVYIMELWTWIHHLCMWFGLFLWWLFLVAYGELPLSLSQNMYKIYIGIVAPSPQHWLYLLLIPVAALLPDFFFRAVRRHVDPDPHHIAAEYQWLKEHGGGGSSNKVAPGPLSTTSTRIFQGGAVQSAPGPDRTSVGWNPAHAPKETAVDKEKFDVEARASDGILRPVPNLSAANLNKTGKPSPRGSVNSIVSSPTFRGQQPIMEGSLPNVPYSVAEAVDGSSLASSLSAPSESSAERQADRNIRSKGETPRASAIIPASPRLPASPPSQSAGLRPLPPTASHPSQPESLEPLFLSPTPSQAGEPHTTLSELLHSLDPTSGSHRDFTDQGYTNTQIQKSTDGISSKQASQSEGNTEQAKSEGNISTSSRQAPDQEPAASASPRSSPPEGAQEELCKASDQPKAQ